MKQVIRRVIDRRGRVALIDLPVPHLGPDQVLVQSHYSLISSGTELSTLAKNPAELVKQTIADPWMRQVVTTTLFATGLGQTARRVWHELLKPREIGYSGAGTVLAQGRRVEGFGVGAKVAFAATGHAEVVAPYINHIVPVPDSVPLDQAAFVTVGGIAIQALRRAEVQFGEVVAVFGLGLVGQLCLMIAKAAGCVVIGIDVDPRRTRLATRNGADQVITPPAEDLSGAVMALTHKHGVDATLICASSRSASIINSAMEITRRQGRVVIVGYVKLDIHPKNFLYKEIDLRYSRAYGPGSYHLGYEKGRLDYPFGYVRWTERRNLQEFIRLLATGAVNPGSLIGRAFPVDQAQAAFDALREGTLPGIAALIRYDTEKPPDLRTSLVLRRQPRAEGKVGIGIIGCGNHVLGNHLPNLQALADVEIRGLASATAKNATVVAQRVKATVVTTDVGALLEDPGTDGVLICSTQPEHAEHIQQVAATGKAIFVEKPMVTRLDDFRTVSALMEQTPVLFTLGLNRRYSPLVAKLKELLQGSPEAVTYLISQPYVPPDHWTLDEVEGGGRLIAEGEHFIDLCNHLVERAPVSVHACALGDVPDDLRKLCNFTVTLHYVGATATIVFDESGAKGYPREKVTVMARGQTAVLDDFARLTVFGRRRVSYGSKVRREMGHREALAQFVAAIRGRPNSMLGWEAASLATCCTFAAQESIRTGQLIDLREFRSSLATPAGS